MIPGNLRNLYVQFLNDFTPYMWRNRFKSLSAGKFMLHGCDLQEVREHLCASSSKIWLYIGG
jgi:hypothetical protein